MKLWLASVVAVACAAAATSACEDHEFRCDNGHCIRAGRRMCDGDDDCGDMSDEKNSDCKSKSRFSISMGN